MTTKDIMIQWGFVIAFFWIPLFLFFPSTSHAAVLQSNEGASADTENFGSGHYKGQSFIHGADFELTDIEIWGGLGDSPATSIEIRVYDGEGFGGTLLCSETGVDVSGWPNWSSADWQTISIPCAGLLNGNTYTFGVYPEDGSGSDAIRWATSDTSYTDGVEYYDGSARSTRDTMFRILGTEGGGGGGSGTTTVSSTTLVVNPSQDYFNAILLFYLTLFLMLYLFRKRV